MSPDRWQRVEHIYHAALEKPAAERPAFLAEACGDDSDLRRQVEELIHRTESSSPLDRAAMELLDTGELRPDTQLGPYRIMEAIGAGGMGKVYKAVDTRLGRTVAIKVSKSQFSARFQREARAIAALNHPNICTLYDVGPDYLVMEYVAGEPLKGPLPVDRALAIASSTAGALDAAHSSGIVHRDLKPANILLTKTGPKLLDFGLARQMAAADEKVTQPGAVAGTLAYMAPEQLQGREADARSDIFAFGLVLYEMLTGRRAFEAADSASLIAATLTAPPPALRESLPEATPALERVVSRCLAKDPEARWQSARDLKDELEWIAGEKDRNIESPRPHPRRLKRSTLTMAALSVLLALAVWGWLRGRATTESLPLVRFTIEPPPGERFVMHRPQISPDGRKIVFFTLPEVAGYPSRLWIHHVFTGESSPLIWGGDNMLTLSGSVWSPDSNALALYSRDSVVRFDLATQSQAGTLIREPLSDFAWGPGDSYLVSVPGKGLFWSSKGSVRKQVTVLAANEPDHLAPQFLPGGRDFLFAVRRAAVVETWLGSLDGKPPRLLLPALAYFAPPDYLLYPDGNAVMARRFDRSKGMLAANAETVVSAMALTYNYWQTFFSVSETGVLAFLRDTPTQGTRLAWYDRAGKPIGTVGAAGDYYNPALSPDGRRLAVAARDFSGRRDIHVFDLERGIDTRLTFEARDNTNPTWSPDGSQIAYSANPRGYHEIYVRPSSGMGQERALLKSSVDQNPVSWSHDGKTLFYNSRNAVTERSLWTLDIGSAASMLLHDVPARQDYAEVSPDNHWVLYRSRESGSLYEVYVEPWPPDGQRWPVTGAHTAEAHWRGDGAEILCESNGSMMAVDFHAVGSRAQLGHPRELFRLPPVRTAGRNWFAVSPDGQRILLMTQQREALPVIVVVVNWPRLLENR
ncbi:MAG TPA: protein kinase [Bryobacteraceae bacterium]|nr:protein kinase [Bryobacteraceae bacterium]